MGSRYEYQFEQFSRTGATAATALTDIGDPILVSRGGFTQMWFEILNGATTLTDFALLGKLHVDGAEITLLSSTGWDTVGNMLLVKNGTLKTLANATRGSAWVYFGGLYSLQFQASVASSTTTPIILGTLFR